MIAVVGGERVVVMSRTESKRFRQKIEAQLLSGVHSDKKNKRR